MRRLCTLKSKPLSYPNIYFASFPGIKALIRLEIWILLKFIFGEEMDLNIHYFLSVYGISEWINIFRQCQILPGIQIIFT